MPITFCPHNIPKSTPKIGTKIFLFYSPRRPDVAVLTHFNSFVVTVPIFFTRRIRNLFFFNEPKLRLQGRCSRNKKKVVPL